MSAMGNEFSGLPMGELIGGPLKAACDAQVRLAIATANFINLVGFNRNAKGQLIPRQVDFSYWQPLPLETKYKITGVTITNPGSRYTTIPTVIFSDPPAGGTRAAGAVVTVTTGGVNEVTVTNSGNGYTSAPTVTFSNPPAGGTLATGTVTLGANNQIANVEITNPGSGYISAPTVTFSDPSSGGTLAAGTATIEIDTSQKTETNLQQVKISVPFLAIVNVPSLMVKNVDIVFDMEVKSSETHKDSLEIGASGEFAAQGGWGGFGAEVRISGSVSSRQENTRSTDRSAKYHVQVTARDDGMPEGLSRVLDILQKAIAPVSKSEAKSLKQANVT